MISPDKVDDDVRMRDCLRYGFFVSYIIFLWQTNENSNGKNTNI